MLSCDAAGYAPIAGSRPASDRQRPISQPFVLLNDASTGVPRQVPVTVAFSGPPYCCVHMRSFGTGGSAVAPFFSSAAHAASGVGWSPPAGSQVSRQVVVPPEPSSTTIVSSVAPAPGDTVTVPSELDGEGSGVEVTLPPVVVDPVLPGAGASPHAATRRVAVSARTRTPRTEGIRSRTVLDIGSVSSRRSCHNATHRPVAGFPSSLPEVPMFPPAVPSVDPAGVPSGARVLDVREPDEWEAGHIAGALHIPLAELPGRLGELPGDLADDDRLVVVCRSGNRSGRAVAWLSQNGYGAVNLDGGMGAWAASGRPMVSETGDTPAVL